MLLNYFYVSLKVINKDYMSQLKKIDTPYLLKEGDWIYSAGHNGKGKRTGISKILNITKDGLILKERVNNKKIFLSWINEYNNKLIIEPFPVFNEDIKLNDIKNVNLDKCIDIFDIFDFKQNNFGETIKYINWNKKWLIPYYREFVKNIDNIIIEQISFFK